MSKLAFSLLLTAALALCSTASTASAEGSRIYLPGNGYRAHTALPRRAALHRELYALRRQAAEWRWLAAAEAGWLPGHRPTPRIYFHFTPGPLPLHVSGPADLDE